MLVVIIHLVCCSFMTGVIWLIQLLHYPMFSYVEKSEFSDFHKKHSQLITWIVGPMMLAELLTGIYASTHYCHETLIQLNIGMLAIIWLSTAFLSVPHHNRLAQNKDLATIDKLVMSNWPRTLLWSVRTLIIVYWIYSAGIYVDIIN